MNRNEKLKKYLGLKKSLENVYYKNYPLNKVLGSDIAIYIWGGGIKHLLSLLFYSFSNINELISTNKLVTYTIEREDYIDLIKEYFPDALKQPVTDYSNQKYCISSFLIRLKYIKIAYAYTRSLKLNYFEKLSIFILVIFAISIIEEVERKDVHCEEYISFNSAFKLESFWCYYFRKRGINTIGLQHGMYFKFLNNTPIDVINYENACSNELWFWGEYSRNSVIDLLPHDTDGIIYGYPKAEVKLDRSSVNDILILLPRAEYLSESIELINRIKKLQESFVLRSHPSVDISKNLDTFDKKFFSINNKENLKDLLSNTKYKAVISFNSTALFEAIRYGQCCIYYESGNNEFENPGIVEWDGVEPFPVVNEALFNNRVQHFFSDINYQNDGIYENSYNLPRV